MRPRRRRLPKLSGLPDDGGCYENGHIRHAVRGGTRPGLRRELEISVTFLQQPEMQPQDPHQVLVEYVEAEAHRLILAPVLERTTAERVLEKD